MSCFYKWYKEQDVILRTLVCGLWFVVCGLFLVSTSAARLNEPNMQDKPNIYVPQQDMPALIKPQDKAVLMDRKQFEALLVSAQAAETESGGLKLGQITQADYSVEVSGDIVSLTGKLQVLSTTNEPVRIVLGFGQTGLNRVMLDNAAAPLGYDQQGRLTLIIASKGNHQLEVEGTTKLQELTNVGMQFSTSLPDAVAGAMKLSTPGDIEIHATVPVSQRAYDSSKDRTTATLTVGGLNRLTVVLAGNGRQDNERTLLLGDSAETLNLTSSSQNLGCLYTVQVLRRGVRQLQFRLAGDWTITDVTCPNLVRWSVEKPKEPNESQTLTVNLTSAKVGETVLHIEAAAPRKTQLWTSPAVVLVGAELQRGYLVINTDETLAVRGERLTSARREDVANASIQGLDTNIAGRLYFHWGEKWSANLDLEDVALRRTTKENQRIVVSAQQVTLTGNFEVTAVEREMFNMAFTIRGPADDPCSAGNKHNWQIAAVLVNGQSTDSRSFEYRVIEKTDYRLLHIELAQPVRPEKVANVTIVMQFVPQQWDWPSDAADRSVSVPLIESQAETVSGNVSISAVGDLEAAPEKVPAQLEAVPVGRMVALGMERQIQYAYSYNVPMKNQIQLHVSRQRPRLSAESVGLVNVKTSNFTGDWRIIYSISRASTKRLYLLADKSIGREIQIFSPMVSFSSQSIIPANAVPESISGELARRYDIWQLDLDNSSTGQVVLNVHYDRPMTDANFLIPLVRPLCDSNNQGQVDELLAIQADPELALRADANSTKEIDAIDLPALPVEASRILAAYQLDAAATARGAAASIMLKTVKHKNYEIPSALVLSASLTTYLDAQLWQRTEENFNIANASRQFLRMKLPEGSQLWSLQVNNVPVKPQRSAEGDYQVTLGRLGGNVTVKVIYAYQPKKASFAQVELGAVELPGLQINQLSWSVVPPPDYVITSQQTNMQTIVLQRQRPALLQLYDYLKNLRYRGIHILPQLNKARVMRQSIRGEPLTMSNKKEAKYDMSLEEKSADESARNSSTRTTSTARTGTTTAGRTPTQILGTDVQQQVPEPVATQPQAQTGRGRGAGFGAGMAGSDISGGGMFQDAANFGRGMTQQAGQAAVPVGITGRYTLPITLVPIPGAGPSERFTGIGKSELIIGMTNQPKQRNMWIFGFILVITLGLTNYIRHKSTAGAGMKNMLSSSFCSLCFIILAVTLAALWWPGVASLANGIFWGCISLLVVYGAICVTGWLLRRIGWLPKNLPTAALIFVFVLGLPSVTQAQKSPAPVIPVPDSNRILDKIIVPYTGSPENAANSDKVLIPYARFVELWNKAHPEDKIAQPGTSTEISLSDVRYNVTVSNEQMALELTANIRTYGKEQTTLSLPMTALAVTEVTLNNKPAQMRAGAEGIILMLDGDTTGRLQLKAIGKPEYFGQRGSIAFSLPPLPAAVMDVVLPQEGLELEVDKLESEPVQKKTAGKTQWTFGLGLTRSLTMRWLPKIETTTTDNTIMANSEHDVYAYHWSVLGVSKITYSFSSGERDRFVILVPQGSTITYLSGQNVRDYRQAGERTVDNRTFNVTEVRLQRAAKKQAELSVRWLRDIPASDTSEQIPLVMAGDVSRESGTITLYCAGGMGIQVADVTGGRRTDTTTSPTNPADLGSNRAVPVAKYYWPYRPFAISVKISRLAVTAKVQIDQLARVNNDRAELFSEATIKAEQGKLFSASFSLPRNYELLSVTGSAVKNFYFRQAKQGQNDSNSGDNFVNVEFDSGRTEAKMALVLIRKNVQLDDFNVPVIRYIEPLERNIPKQQGRIAVQVAASLDAKTISSNKLSSITPASLQSWLTPTQIRPVQFAYRYEDPNMSLRLNIRSKTVRIQAEIFSGLVVTTTSANYTYRLRYTISGSPVEKLSFRLPREYASLVAVESPSMRSITVADANDGRTKWTVNLLNEVTGVVDVLVNFALPIDISTQTVAIPRLETDSTDECRTIVAVQNMSRHEIKIQNTTKLTPLAASEQQTLMSAGMRESLQYVYQSFEQDWSMLLALTAAKTAARIQAVVDLLAMTTVISKDGRCRYEVRVELQNRSEQFLKIKVPSGLSLWSAYVASVPVKPVFAAGSAKGEVLIPLVKTSPGGLPYDIVLYLADENAEPLIKPVSGITRLAPPGITILGVPVTRTTWSLRLPSGFKYIRPGGNMNPLAGTLEMLSLNIEARLEQLTRLDKSYKEVASTGKGSQIQTAGENFEIFNRKLSSEISQAEKFLAENPDQIKGQEVERLRSKLDAQQQRQVVVMQGNGAFIQEQRKQTDNNMNLYLNVSGSNAGIAENVRNDALNEMPGFVSQHEKQQLERLQKDLQFSEQKSKVLDNGYAQKPAAVEPGKTADDLLAGNQGDKADISSVLNEVARKNESANAQRQQQLKSQLDQLQDNRMQRYFSNQSGSQALNPGEFDRQSQMTERNVDNAPATQQPSSQVQSRDRESGTTTGAGRGGRGAQAPAIQNQMVNFPNDSPYPRTNTGLTADYDAAANAVAVRGFQPYTATNIYSLPVTLPAGEIQLDFARSSGDAEISIWAIPVDGIGKLLKTAAITVTFVIIFVIVKLWPKYNVRKPIKTRRIISYIFLFVVLFILLGLTGLVISFFIVFLSEIIRFVFA